MATDRIELCLRSNEQETDWQSLYHAAFRDDQKTPMDQLIEGIRNGQFLLHRTLDHEGDILCFSITNILPSMALLAYIATSKTKRSAGIGSSHMKALLADLEKDHPGLFGLFAEIESTKGTSKSGCAGAKTGEKTGEKADEKADEKTETASSALCLERQRRFRFYERLSFQRMPHAYTIPSYDPGMEDEPGELLFYEFPGARLCCDDFPGIVKEIYTRAYNLPLDDPRVKRLKRGCYSGKGCFLIEKPGEAINQATES